VSRVDELLAELAPDGVEFAELQTIFELRNGYTPSKAEESFWSGGTVPWFRMEDIRANGGVLSDSIQHVSESAVKGGRLFPADSIIVATSASIGEHALITVPHLCNQRFTSLSVRPEVRERLVPKFAYYYCFKLDEWCRENTSLSSFESVDMGGFRRFRFPLPPLEVQHEIVRTLDAFTELRAALEFELDLRRRQYGFHRDSAMAFGTGTPRVPLGRVVEVRSGWGFPNADQGRPDGDLPFYKVSDMNTRGNETTMRLSNNYVSMLTASKLGIRPAPAGTVIFPKIGAAVATNKKRLLSMTSAYDNNVMGLVPGSSIDPRYLYYWMQTLNLSNFAHDSGAVPSIRKSDVEAIDVPLPPLDEQRRIADILDTFDALVNDLSVGLPAELKARRQQYEYYRDKLLTFPEAA
jgi:type I restriction enzyme S subunit